MSVLSDKEIITDIERGHLSIEPFKRKNLTPNGYDLSAGEIFVPELVRKINHGRVLIPARTWFVISTEEYLKFGPQLVGECWIRTTYARKGFLPSYGKIDAGFEGNLTLNFYNAAHSDAVLKSGERVVQLVLQRLKTTPTSLYEEKSGNYQGQRGVTLKPGDGG